MIRMKMFHNDSLSCEPILRRMPNGNLLCVCQCGDVTEPAPGNRVYCFLSKDNGETWSAPHSIYPENGQAVYLTEVHELKGVIRVFLQTHSGRFLNMRCVVMESRDNGETWMDAGAPPYYSDFCFVRGMLRMSNGEIIIPCQYFPISREENMRLVVASQNASTFRYQKAIWDAEIDHLENNLLISADEGETYEHIIGPRVAIKGNTGRSWNWTEPTLAELSDQTIVMLLRVNGTGYLWRSESKDFGRTWTEPTVTDIPNPGNKPKLLNLPDGRIALINTPNSGSGMFARNPLAVWISSDDMKTWEDRRVISDVPLCYCYPDGFYEDGHILFTIELNRHEILFVDIEV